MYKKKGGEEKLGPVGTLCGATLAELAYRPPPS